ncbi:hypothetical protein WJX72_008665 [[Myrmecia] bisecta]|uniref:Thioredoxin domain-containing protein n=1 Tax=[Myrmecia] bisecta TaxID=41462 RepID=A0AAW1PG41_9CHLO
MLPFMPRRRDERPREGGEKKRGGMPSFMPTVHREEQPPQNGSRQYEERRAGSPRVGVSAPAGHGKVLPGCPLPHIVLNTVQGGKLEIGATTGQWQMIVVYRGKHCPVSKNYLASLQQIIVELEDLGVEVIAVSSDGRERAESFAENLRAATESKEISFKIAYGLPISVAQEWGLYISQPRNMREADKPFPEPALFLVDPDGVLNIIDISNSPFARPDLRILVEGIRYIQENDYPVRGTYGIPACAPESTAMTRGRTAQAVY